MAVPGQFELSEDAGTLRVRLQGDWTVPAQSPAARLEREVAQRSFATLAIDCETLGDWDSLLVATLLRLRAGCATPTREFSEAGLPQGVLKLMALASVVKPHQRPPPLAMRFAWLARIGSATIGLLATCEFIGSVAVALVRLLLGRANTRLVDFLYFVFQAGPNALGIISLTSVLVGMILAYLGSIQLQQFGAQVYVADLVAIGMVREMGALMTAVIMAGRTGAAYAAQLGTMQTREEIDAISMLGISPIEFLVVPRMLALVLIMPLLCIYSDALGMAGGALVALTMDVSWTQYVNETQLTLTFTHIWAGVAKSVVFGALIAVAGCRAGIQCGRSSEAVGQATTTAVVTAVVYLIVADAAFNIMYQRLGI